MGCNSSQPTFLDPQFGNVQYKMINNCIDKMPLFVINKIRNKFYSGCKNYFDLSQNQFKIMYKPYIVKNVQFQNNSYQDKDLYINQLLNKLFQYFTNYRNSKLTFKLFIQKYAILSKCQDKILSTIMFNLYSDNQLQITKQQYTNFISQQKKYFCFNPSVDIVDKINSQLFYLLLKQSGFLWAGFRARFSLVSKDDLPFEAIINAIDYDIGQFQVGAKYYLLSSSWFQRWRYYYTWSDSEGHESKPTTFKKKNNSQFSRRKRIIRQTTSRKDVTCDSIIQRPSQIQFDDIQSQYRGQLKQNIRLNYQLTIISLQTWGMLKQTIKTQTQYTRVANSTQTLDLYPKNIYFFQTNANGQIIDQSFQLVSIEKDKKLKDINVVKHKQLGKYYYFVKNFGNYRWIECNQLQPLCLCSESIRFIVIQTQNKDNFMELYTRKKVNQTNVTYGDKVFTFFTFNKKFIPAYIIRMPTSKRVTLHYIGYNYRYETEVQQSDLFLTDSPEPEALKNSEQRALTDGFSFKGLQNIGNTCFINAIIQCLIGSPILQNYLISTKFKQSKQPLLFQISQIAKALLANKDISPTNLKQVIDQQLQVFSDNKQHDAQQFLNLLIVKLNQQIKKISISTQTIFQFLFDGKVQSTLQCLKCPNKKQKIEDFNIVSLPIPQPKQISISSTIFPIYTKSIKKIVIRLSYDGLLSDYLKQLENKLGQNISRYIVINKIKKINNKYFQNKFRKMTFRYLFKQFSQLGIVANLELYFFQKFKEEEISSIQQYNVNNFENSNYFQCFQQLSQKWRNARYTSTSQKSQIQLMNADYTLTTINNKKKTSPNLKPLGTHLGFQTFKLILVRKFNQTTCKMEVLGSDFLIAYPNSVTFRQLEHLLHICMKNMLIQKNKKQYFIKIYSASSKKCLFCKSEQQRNIENKKYVGCCKITDQQQDTPLVWIAMKQGYLIFIDWPSTQNLNTNFTNYLDWDPPQEKAHNLMKTQKIKIQDCLVQYQKPENVEMQCEKCQNRVQRRTQTMKNVPNILILHMKQYRVGLEMSLIKMQANLKWIQYFDISSYSIGQKGIIYQLYAYVTHLGTSQSGHYTCAVKRKQPFENKKVWVMFDDLLATVLQKQQKNIDSAYLLFFKRIDMPNSAYINFTDF